MIPDRLILILEQFYKAVLLFNFRTSRNPDHLYYRLCLEKP